MELNQAGTVLQKPVTSTTAISTTSGLNASSYTGSQVYALGGAKTVSSLAIDNQQQRMYTPWYSASTTVSSAVESPVAEISPATATTQSVTGYLTYINQSAIAIDGSNDIYFSNYNGSSRYLHQQPERQRPHLRDRLHPPDRLLRWHSRQSSDVHCRECQQHDQLCVVHGIHRLQHQHRTNRCCPAGCGFRGCGHRHSLCRVWRQLTPSESLGNQWIPGVCGHQKLCDRTDCDAVCQRHHQHGWRGRNSTARVALRLTA